MLYGDLSLSQLRDVALRLGTSAYKLGRDYGAIRGHKFAKAATSRGARGLSQRSLGDSSIRNSHLI